MNRVSQVLAKMVATFDLGGSQSKGIVQIYPDGLPMVIAMEPEVADVRRESITHLGNRLYSDYVWVGIGEEYYALGALAKDAFAGTAALKDLKYHYALPKITGLLWWACHQLDLKAVEAYVDLLLPPGEISDGGELGKKLASVLSQGVITPTGKLKAKLRNFQVAPEGSGILAYRRRGLGESFKQKNIGLLMLGYRNASFLLFKKGNPGASESTDLGMNWVVEQFVERTSVGLLKNDKRLPKALVEASKGNLNALRSLSRKSGEEIESDLKLFNSVLPIVRDDYCRALIRWIRNIAAFNEVVICGGTSEFVRPELTEHFQKEGIPISWNGGVDIPKPLDTLGLGDRVADVWTAHITYIKELDNHFGYKRTQPLVPDNYQHPGVRNRTLETDLWNGKQNSFLTI
ncbi:ParM/StbA family protein [Nostoc sp. FACHB-87]|uniref:ParM/StbA family protein n=1 Tax=Nostocaceae TaxID=1162 RepID=UPI0016829C8A|nr:MULTISPECIES: ParM/StbA family protein [Nostocaceae]MBD2458295.1 ParM/StbA family protein [Nostoc sp. FACHB-87]MBD2479443.1 ParM/StbA family protein [Anabaena sp. FACHB-83]